MLARILRGAHYLLIEAKCVLAWVLFSTENHNFSYEYSDRCKDGVIDFIALVLRVPPAYVQNYVSEFDAMRPAIAQRYERLRQVSSQPLDAPLRWGKQWFYAVLVRVKKPRIVVELGVDRGLGSWLMGIALELNRSQGSPGLLYAVDPAPHSGVLIKRDDNNPSVLISHQRGETFLKESSHRIDILIMDTFDDETHKMEILNATKSHLSPDAIIVCTWYSSAIRTFASENGMNCLFFKDEPMNHWFKGDGLGIIFA